MFKLNYILMAILISSGLLMATTLETSNHLSNLEIVTDGCENRATNVSTQDSDEKEVRVPKTQEVETVNFSLHGCNGIASFPVTVRSNKKRGE